MNDEGKTKGTKIYHTLSSVASLLKSTQAAQVSIPEEILAQDKAAQSPLVETPETPGPSIAEHDKAGSDANPQQSENSPRRSDVSE